MCVEAGRDNGRWRRAGHMPHGEAVTRGNAMQTFFSFYCTGSGMDCRNEEYRHILFINDHSYYYYYALCYKLEGRGFGLPDLFTVIISILSVSLVFS